MNSRWLGRDGLIAAAIGWDCAGVSVLYGPAGRSRKSACLARYPDAQLAQIDNAT